MTPLRTQRIGVAILTGFLGAGKTTVLNHLVKHPAMTATAVIINEFGEVGIDHLLVETSTEVMVELNNGCICCTIRGDLADKLGSLGMWLDTGRVPPVERVVVETTGLADPAPIMHTLMVEPDLLSRYRLDRVVTVVDAIAGADALDRFPEATKQIAVADAIVVAKTDLVATHSSERAYAELRRRIAALNPRASVVEAVRGVIDPQLCFAPRGDEAERAFAELAAAQRGAEDRARHDHDHHEDHDHDGEREAHDLHAAGIESFVVELPRPVEGERFNTVLRDLAADYGQQMLRTKGVVRVAEDPARPAVIHGVQHVFFPVAWLDRWPRGDERSRLVFITQHLDPALVRARFSEAFG